MILIRIVAMYAGLGLLYASYRIIKKDPDTMDSVIFGSIILFIISALAIMGAACIYYSLFPLQAIKFLSF